MRVNPKIGLRKKIFEFLQDYFLGTSIATSDTARTIPLTAPSDVSSRDCTVGGYSVSSRFHRKEGDTTMKRIVISAGLAAFLALSAAGQAAEISASISGTMDPATPFSDAGIVGGGFSSSEELTATGSVPQFNIFGAVLRSYSIKGSLVLRSDGTITIQADNTAAGGQVEAGGVSDSCPDSSIFGSIHCFEAVASNNFSIDYFSDFGINGLIGTGSVPVSGKGVVTMTGGCFAGTNPDGDCSQVLWEHWGSAVLEGLRVEWGYCTTPGEEGCPDLVLGVNSPRQGDAAVPEPITLALFGAGLTGLAVSRRIRPKRRS